MFFWSTYYSIMELAGLELAVLCRDESCGSESIDSITLCVLFMNGRKIAVSEH